MHPRLLFLPLLVALFACSDQPLSTAPNASVPRFDIADAARDYKSGFYWLPPIVKQPDVSGTFDATLSPTVEICELVGDACGPVLATYTTTSGAGGEYIRLQDDSKYHVNWHTDEFNLSPTNLYRVSVRAGINDVLLGYVDVQPAANGSGLKNIDSDEFMGLVDGRTLPIKFRIETGIVGSVDVEPLEATLDPGGAQQFVAVVRDLHGNVMSAHVVWSSSDENVATVDQTGLATAVAEGIATITATSDRIAGTATLTVLGSIVGSVSVEPLEATADPGATQQFVAIVRDIHGNVINAAVVWSSSDENVATVDQTGLATAVADGIATITATSDGISGTATLTVLGSGTGGTVIVSAGGGHTCALGATGMAFCWGLGTSGQLGNGAAVNSPTPVAVTGELTFAALGTGVGRTCGVTGTGEAYCWGSALLGDGTPSSSLTPVAVTGGLTFGPISAGQNHTCAVTTGGQAYCWGVGTFGRLGNGSDVQQLAPAAVSGDLPFASISAGLSHTCAIITDELAYCWGLGSRGRLGNGSVANQLAPAAVSGDLTFASISAGNEHTCGITTDGLAYCWGAGTSGRLGTGGQFDELAPAAVAGGLTFAAITTGENHSCGITTDGLAYCWGSGSAGQLGNGSQQAFFVPTPVSGGLTFASISAGASYTCGVTTSEEVYCWGFGTFGQLGNGTLASRFTPTLVAAFP
jgi:alpha-tubulin suppressor-like RCC1 family protein